MIPTLIRQGNQKIELYNGFDVSDILNNFEVFQNMRKIQKYIMDNSITEYSELMDMLFCTNQTELWQVASSHTMFFEAYIRSKRNRIKNAVIKTVAKEIDSHGEVNIIRIMRSYSFAIKSR